MKKNVQKSDLFDKNSSNLHLLTMIKNKSIFLFTILTIFMSCEERVDILSSNDELGKMVLECELSPSKRIEAKLYTLGNFNQLNEVEYPTKAIVRMTIGTDVELRFKYDDENKVYFVDNHIVDPSRTYTIYAFKNEQEEKAKNGLEAVTQIPVASNFKVSNTTVQERKDSKGLMHKVVNFKASLPVGSNKYYRLTATRKIYKNVMVNGSLKSVFSGVTETLKFNGNDEIPLAFQQSSYNGCLFFDASRFDYDNIDFSFSTNSMGEGDQLNSIQYDLEALSESTYRYHVAKSKQINAQIAGISEPVINYTNVANNGYGFLGGSSMTSDTIAIK